MRIVISLKSGFQVIHQAISIFLSITKFAFASFLTLPFISVSSIIVLFPCRHSHPMSSLLPSGSSTCFALKMPTATLHHCSQRWLWNTCSKPYTKRESLRIARVTVEMTQTRLYTFSHPYLSPQFLFFAVIFFFLALGNSWCLFYQVFFFFLHHPTFMSSCPRSFSFLKTNFFLLFSLSNIYGCPIYIILLYEYYIFSKM